MPEPSTTTEPAPGEWSTYRRLLGYAWPYRTRLILGSLFGLLYGAGTAGLLLSLRGGLDQAFEDVPSGISRVLNDWISGWMGSSMMGIAVLLLGFTVLRGVGFFLSKYLVEWVGFRVVMNIRNALFAHIQDLPLAILGANRTGELMSRTTSDTQMVERGVSSVIGDLMTQPFVLAAAVVTLIDLDARLAGISLLLFPICILPVVIFGRRVRRYARQGQSFLGDLSAVQQETITGSRIVKAFGTENEEKQRFAAHARSVFRRQVRVTLSRAAVTPIIELISICTACALLMYAKSTGLTLASLLTFLGALVVMYDPVKRLSRLHLGIQQASAAADRIFEILDIPLHVRDRDDAVPFAGEVAEIHFEHVSFRYEEEDVVHDFDLRVKAGECIALVGGSGAGKTTLVSLLPRFYDVTEGTLRLNGRDIREFTLQSLRRQFSIVTQDTILFNRSVSENIAYGQPDATPEDIEQAARRAHAHEFISDMEAGYDTVIGERGQRLSGGQRQRLAIARALLRNPPILILDEATSALDTEAERHVQAALDELMKGRTVFAIAHRLSTIRHADRIVVMKEGRIVEQGTHEALIAHDGAYKYYYDLQFGAAEQGVAGNS